MRTAPLTAWPQLASAKAHATASQSRVASRTAPSNRRVMPLISRLRRGMGLFGEGGIAPY